MSGFIFSLVVAVEYRLIHILSHLYPDISFLVSADFVWIYSVVFLRVIIIEIDSGSFGAMGQVFQQQPHRIVIQFHYLDIIYRNATIGWYRIILGPL